MAEEDGESPEVGYVVVNLDGVDGPSLVGDGSVDQTLEEARTFCREQRQESGNQELYVYRLAPAVEAEE